MLTEEVHPSGGDWRSAACETARPQSDWDRSLGVPVEFLPLYDLITFHSRNWLLANCFPVEAADIIYPGVPITQPAVGSKSNPGT